MGSNKMRALKTGEEIIQGKIQNSNVKEGESAGKQWQKISFLINDDWYGSFNSDLQTFKDGQDVRLIWKYDKTKVFRNIVGDCMEKFKEETIEEQPMPTENPTAENLTHCASVRELRIIRQCCLKAAVEFLSDDEEKQTSVALRIAELFEEWVHR